MACPRSGGKAKFTHIAGGLAKLDSGSTLAAEMQCKAFLHEQGDSVKLPFLSILLTIEVW